MELWIIIGLILAVLFIGLLWWLVKKGIILAINSAIGFFALFLLQYTLMPTLIINLWSVLIVAIGGIFGLIVVLVLHWSGLAF